VEVIIEVFSIIKLEKNIKKTSAKTFVCDSEIFNIDFKEISSQLNNFGWMEALVDVFFYAS